MYDLIGDIHGHADELKLLLTTLGYSKSQTSWRHPHRQVIFVGDFIDRGPKIRQVLEIVRPMVEEGAAKAVMGNHELNALAYHTENPASSGKFLRSHSDKNVLQHRQTVEQLRPDELRFYLEWFRKLPLWLELDALRVVHACWDGQLIAGLAQALGPEGRIAADLLPSACTPMQPLYDPVEIVLKGKEVKLPQGVSFVDKDGHKRTHTRVRWYLPPAKYTYRSYAFTDSVDCELAIEDSVIAAAAPYPASDKPVFFGHYWLFADQPRILASNVACLDYSVAKEGMLVAYRWDGEAVLSNHNFVSVPSR